MCPHRGISLFISKFLESGNLCQPFCTFYLFPSIDTSGSLAPSTLYKKYSVPNIPTVICWCCSNEMVGMIINRGHALVAKKTNLNDQNKKRRHTQKPDITDLPEEKIRGKIHIVIRRYVKKKNSYWEIKIPSQILDKSLKKSYGIIPGTYRTEDGWKCVFPP